MSLRGVHLLGTAKKKGDPPSDRLGGCCFGGLSSVAPGYDEPREEADCRECHSEEDRKASGVVCYYYDGITV